jgi:hypothetical protein
MVCLCRWRNINGIDGRWRIGLKKCKNENPKLQDPSSRETSNLKLQARRCLVVEIWWFVGLGPSGLGLLSKNLKENYDI